MTFDYQPLDWVLVTFAGVNYKGRVNRCHLHAGGDITYTVDYVDDGGNMKDGAFRADELSKQK